MTEIGTITHKSNRWLVVNLGGRFYVLHRFTGEIAPASDKVTWHTDRETAEAAAKAVWEERPE